MICNVLPKRSHDPLASSTGLIPDVPSAIPTHPRRNGCVRLSPIITPTRQEYRFSIPLRISAALFCASFGSSTTHPSGALEPSIPALGDRVPSVIVRAAPGTPPNISSHSCRISSISRASSSYFCASSSAFAEGVTSLSCTTLFSAVATADSARTSISPSSGVGPSFSNAFERISTMSSPGFISTVRIPNICIEGERKDVLPISIAT